MYFFKISSQFCSVDQSPFSRILFHMRSSCYQKTKGEIKNARRPTQSLEGLRSEIQNWETELFKELPALELSNKNMVNRILYNPYIICASHHVERYGNMRRSWFCIRRWISDWRSDHQKQARRSSLQREREREWLSWSTSS